MLTTYVTGCLVALVVLAAPPEATVDDAAFGRIIEKIPEEDRRVYLQNLVRMFLGTGEDESALQNFHLDQRQAWAIYDYLKSHLDYSGDVVCIPGYGCFDLNDPGARPTL
ncbi:uncharacterized protein LOC132707062 [Cylas formicarius]|uniref:uncharacterized protein LOC132707062 n=1 Tax=Cylas formicarius TaxID=197179 RepID=UPI002958B19D|nr:uncharacterized protein LOC132707062 [Cylas formicarius]